MPGGTGPGSGSVDGYDNRFTLAISNAQPVGATPYPPAWARAFPAIMEPADCNVTGMHGPYLGVHDITFSILGRCETFMRTSSRGALKCMWRQLRRPTGIQPRRPLPDTGVAASS